jgi:hypothetical protein
MEENVVPFGAPAIWGSRIRKETQNARVQRMARMVETGTAVGKEVEEDRAVVVIQGRKCPLRPGRDK